MSDKELEKYFCEFLGAFEIVFHYDWDYTKLMIGDEEENCTFIKPGIENETEDWGARGQLLEKYRNLKSALKERNIKPIISKNWQEHIRDECSDKLSLD